MKQSVEARFWKKVDMIPFTTCHIWNASTYGFGYGRFHDENHKFWSAHRFAYQLKHGPIHIDMSVLHTCDNPLCVNTDHLYLGTYANNAQDREQRERGNHAKGTCHGRNRLSAAQVYEIRDAYDTGKYSFYRLGKIYGVNSKVIVDIVDRKIWSYLN